MKPGATFRPPHKRGATHGSTRNFVPKRRVGRMSHPEAAGVCRQGYSNLFRIGEKAFLLQQICRLYFSRRAETTVSKTFYRQKNKKSRCGSCVAKLSTQAPPHLPPLTSPAIEKTSVALTRRKATQTVRQCYLDSTPNILIGPPGTFNDQPMGLRRNGVFVDATRP